MKFPQTLTPSLVLDRVVTWRILLPCRLGKRRPELSEAVGYAPEEVAVLEVH